MSVRKSLDDVLGATAARRPSTPKPRKAKKKPEERYISKLDQQTNDNEPFKFPREHENKHWVTAAIYKKFKKKNSKSWKSKKFT